jgi:phosphodiesterase/alkaline phosphatase D-like protein
LLRYVDDTRATIWVETDRPCEVEVRTSAGRHRASTWSVHGHHYALVRVEDLHPCTETPYTVALDGEEVWPPRDSPFPPSVIRTPDPTARFRLAFGSCRRASPDDDEHLEELGPDALVVLAQRMAADPTDWPDMLLLLGDQLYADDPSDEICERLREGADGRNPDIIDEIQNFEEYTWLYHEAWGDPAVRWLFSTVPVAMLLDDHDLRDDWNTSLSWRRWITSQPWWRDRVVGAYGSYWVYQHLGNLSPDELDADEVYTKMVGITDDEERTRFLDEVAWNADVDNASIRFSFFRDLGGGGRRVRLVAIDSRCSRHLDPDDRRMVDRTEWAWVRDRVLERDVDHLVLASTLPFLMVPGVHHLEGWDEAIASGAWGRPGKWIGERVRQMLDFEHWAAFRASFAEFTDLLEDVVRRDDPPATVLMLSGDVHCSYTGEARLTGVDHPNSAIHQLTMSPFRNDIERIAKAGMRWFDRRLVSRTLHRLGRWADVDDAPLDWRIDHGLWFENGVMTVALDGRGAAVAVDHARVSDDGEQRLDRTAEIDLAATVSATSTRR